MNKEWITSTYLLSTYIKDYIGSHKESVASLLSPCSMCTEASDALHLYLCSSLSKDAPAHYVISPR